MKTVNNFILSLILFVCPNVLFCQIFLETMNGTEIIFNPFIKNENGNIFGNINVSEKSLQLKYIYSLDHNIIPQSILIFGIKGKPLDGNLSLLNLGNFTPSTNLNVTYSRKDSFLKKILRNNIEFVNFKIDYTNESFKYFNSDTSFITQLSTINFNNIGFTLNYNIHFTDGIFSMTTGVKKLNNFSDLESIEVREYKTLSDSTGNTTREYGSVLNAKQGQYKEYWSIPIHIAYTTIQTEDPKFADMLIPGISFYYKTVISNLSPQHNIGSIVFLTKQDSKTGIRTSIIGLGVQLNDMFNIYEKNTSILKSLTFNLTSTINFFSF